MRDTTNLIASASGPSSATKGWKKVKREKEINQKLISTNKKIRVIQKLKYELKVAKMSNQTTFY